MALTATAQSALPRERTWDEAIVPALRKRLKDESTALAKRISAASITSVEEQAAQYYAARPGTSTSTGSQSKPSAIPRPSLQSSRTADSSTVIYAGAHPPPFQRARALSQPYPFQSLTSADSPPLSETARSISPVNAPKGTRIPVSRGRTGSTSSQAQSTYNGNAGRTNGTVGYSRQNGEPSESQLYPVEERIHANSQTSRSTVRLPRHQVSDIFQEQAPFFPNSSSQSHVDYGFGRQSPERMSSDSEEHPFEHWYRGDVARNGGVGELRVARRQEMLDIANYGHTLRKASGKLTNGAASSRSRSNSRGRDLANGRQRTRTRADSVGARESIYIDEDEIAAEAAVMDERPLTDLESDGYEDQLDDYYTQAVQPHPNGSVSSPSLDRSETPTSRMTQNTTRSRIPQPTQRSRTTTPTPGKPSRSASENGMSGPSSSSPSSKVPRSASQSKAHPQAPPTSSTPSTPTAKRRGKSPAGAAPASASKRAKTKVPPSSMNKKAREDEHRRSVGQYPTPEGDEHAIPTWTQSVPANGNWDDVVIPVVARKKGLQDQYETADGSPKPKEPEPMIIEPAPGTFGFDAAKYRRRYSGNLEHIQMNEFGQIPEPAPVQELLSPAHDKTRETPSPFPPTPSNRGDSDSPPPFSRYAEAVRTEPRREQQPMVAPLPPQQQEKQLVREEPEDGGGASCCKCVIM